MNLNQIVAFRAVMNSTSISDAARKLGRTQPAVSLAIRSLEETLGLKLFERRGRQLIPVPEAHYLHAESQEILNRLSSVTRTMQSLARGSSGSLVVTAMPGSAAFVFPRFVASVVANLESVDVTITSRSSQQIEELARTQSIDFGFCDAPAPHSDEAQYHSDVVSAECFLAMPSNHRLASRDSVSIGELDGLPMGTLQSWHLHQNRTAEQFAQHGATCRTVIESQTFIPLLFFIRANKCLAVVDPLTVVNELELAITNNEVVFRRLESSFRYDYAILTPKHRPLSQVAVKARAKWKASIFELLDSINSEPRWEETSDLF